MKVVDGEDDVFFFLEGVSCYIILGGEYNRWVFNDFSWNFHLSQFGKDKNNFDMIDIFQMGCLATT